MLWLLKVKTNIVLLLSLLLSLQLFGETIDTTSDLNDATSDEYSWLKTERQKNNASKFEKFRKAKISKMFFSGEINFVFFYHPDLYKGNENSHIFDFGYQSRDLRDKKYHYNEEDGYQIKSPWGSVEPGFFGNFAVSASFIDSKFPLFNGNNIKLKFNWEYNWMQASGGFDFIFTPFPFYYTSLGIKIGTGWDWLWDSNGNGILHGMGLNSEDGFESKPLLGPVVTLSYTNTLQMDFAALPFVTGEYKRWMHIIVTASANFIYQSLVTINDDSPYHYITTDNLFNGWRFSSVFQVGYNILIIEDKNRDFNSFRRIVNKKFSILPLLQTTVSFSLSHYNDSKMSDHGWGSDFVNVKLNPLLIFNLPYNFKLIIFSEFANGIKYSEETQGDIYIKNMEYSNWAMGFKTIGIIYGWSF